MKLSTVFRPIAYLWAFFPMTMLGLIGGILTCLKGGKMQVRQGVMEFYGDFPNQLLNNKFGKYAAITLGHVILGIDRANLDRTREHEHVHVRQMELWGPFFLPAYLGSCVWERFRGRNFYYDNWFERDARRRSGEQV
jgi:hypothetical protein